MSELRHERAGQVRGVPFSCFLYERFKALEVGENIFLSALSVTEYFCIFDRKSIYLPIYFYRLGFCHDCLLKSPPGRREEQLAKLLLCHVSKIKN